MDIQQMKYLIAIVQNDFNITKAARKLFITQSALSQFINNFERDEKIEIMNRKNGRLTGLTPSGERVYSYAQEILRMQSRLTRIISEESTVQKGTVNIGIHQTVLRIFFSNFIPQFLEENGEANVKFIEGGMVDIRQQLLEGNLNVAILLEPTELDEDQYEEYTIARTEIAAYVRPDHPLTKVKSLTVNDLADYPVVSFGDNDTVFHLVKNRLEEKGVDKEFLFTSDSWDFLVESTLNSDIVALLPTVDFGNFQKRLDLIGIEDLRFEESIPYILKIVRPIKREYQAFEDYVFNEMLELFYEPDKSLRFDNLK
ncbi:LysR family transcriptional regulator [Aerococcaceae bacterium DSM 111022]|nr:LysR family transcriptional regulator [Aerococcaceae bacterium DSM 111022]MBG9987905.1 LysR family transcriptional regulator [Aerococcaceae bacterium DSM 111176]